MKKCKACGGVLNRLVAKIKKITRPSPDHPWRRGSYKKMLAKKARLGNEKAKEELVLLKT